MYLVGLESQRGMNIDPRLRPHASRYFPEARFSGVWRPQPELVPLHWRVYQYLPTFHLCAKIKADLRSC